VKVAFNSRLPRLRPAAISGVDATIVILIILLLTQGFHMLEHSIQMVQYYLLDQPAARARGLLGAANLEWVHFAWNWLVVAMIAYLLKRGLRHITFWLLLSWAVAHSFEHSYLLLRYLQLSAELRVLELPNLAAAQSLPGIFGKDGWLALRWPFTRLGGLTTASRVTVHFWWNVGELTLLLLAAYRPLKKVFNPLDKRTRPLKQKGSS
jgi:hypothetical protein